MIPIKGNLARIMGNSDDYLKTLPKQYKIK